MLQRNLFAPDEPAELERAAGDPDGLRDYQRLRVDQTLKLFENNRSVLMSLHCGAGKTRTASSIIKHWPGRCLWGAHRDFLCQQARAELSKLTREYVDLEKANWYSGDSRIVVASIPTLRGDRLRKFSPDAFSLIVLDEAHHAASKSWRAVLEHFKDSKVLLITATPKRADKLGMWNVAGVHCDPFGIDAGLSWGSFVPIVPISEFLDEVDLSQIKTSAGDLSLNELEEQIVKSAAHIAQLTVKHTEGLQTIVYTPGVASAHATAASLVKLGKTAASVDADTPWETRKDVLAKFESGEIQYVVNCSVYTEGLDVPGARAIVIARPTKSESLYIQMAGRGGRPEGWIGNLPTAEERKSAIAASGKPNFKLIDLTGHAGRHSLCSATDLLGGKRVKEAVEKVKEKIKQGQGGDKTLEEMLDEEEKTIREQEEESRRKIAEAAARARVQSRQSTFDPLIKLGFDQRQHGAPPGNPDEPANGAQVQWLKDNRLPWKNATAGTYEACKRQAAQWVRDGMASWRQRGALTRAGLDPNVKFLEAKAIIGYMDQSKNWHPNPKIVERVLREYRERNRIPQDFDKAG